MMMMIYLISVIFIFAHVNNLGNQSIAGAPLAGMPDPDFSDPGN